MNEYKRQNSKIRIKLQSQTAGCNSRKNCLPFFASIIFMWLLKMAAEEIYDDRYKTQTYLHTRIRVMQVKTSFFAAQIFLKCTYIFISGCIQVQQEVNAHKRKVSFSYLTIEYTPFMPNSCKVHGTVSTICISSEKFRRKN